MDEKERPADRIVRLMREAATGQPTPTSSIVVNGDGNIFGDQVINNYHLAAAAAAAAAPGADRRALRVSAMNYIRHSCRCCGDATAWIAFTLVEFGTADLDALTDPQLERVCRWCAARDEECRE